MNTPDFTEAAEKYAASIGNIDGTAAFDFQAGALHGWNEAMRDKDELAKAFCRWVEYDSWHLDYTEQRSHSISEKYDYFVKNVWPTYLPSPPKTESSK